MALSMSTGLCQRSRGAVTVGEGAVRFWTARRGAPQPLLRHVEVTRQLTELTLRLLQGVLRQLLGLSAELFAFLGLRQDVLGRLVAFDGTCTHGAAVCLALQLAPVRSDVLIAPRTRCRVEPVEQPHVRSRSRGHR